MTPAPPRPAAAARGRLLADQALRPLAERRQALLILSRRLDDAARRALTADLAARVRTDKRFAPVLGQLMRIALES